MQYPDNDTFEMPWGKYQGLTVAEMVKKDRKYAEFIIKPKEDILRIIQELKTPTPTSDSPQPEIYTGGDSNKTPF